MCDFKCNVDGKDICFELKIYNSDYAIEKNIKRACERLLRLKGDNLILVIGVSDFMSCHQIAHIS